MTLARQGVSAALLGVALLASGAAWAEGPSAVSRQPSGEEMGPPTAEQFAAQEAQLRAEAEAQAAKAKAAAAAAAKPPSWLAKKPEPKPLATKPAMPSMGRLIGLLLVVGSLGGAALYLKKRGKGELKKVVAAKRLSVLSSTRIGPKAHAVVISVNGRQMLLGVTDASVKRLAFLDELADEEDERLHQREREPMRQVRAVSRQPSAVSGSRAVVTEQAVASRSFTELLRAAFSKPQPAATDAASILAAETQDVVGGKPVPSNVRMLDVEGQAQGLVRRLSGPRA